MNVGVLVLGVVSIGGGATQEPEGAFCLFMGMKRLGSLRSSLKYAESALIFSTMSLNNVVQSSAVVGMYLGTLMMWYPYRILWLESLLISESM